jgi:branched-chain amino acid transport system ATP-binding protein
MSTATEPAAPVEPRPSGEAVLQVEDAVLRFGGITALSNVTFSVERGRTFGIIGPNGAGKTALLNCISGVYRLDSGSIKVLGTEITATRADHIAKLGLSRTFQGTEHFKQFTVLDYVLLGRVNHLRSSVSGTLFLWPIREKAERIQREFALGVIERMGLGPFAKANLSDLPYGVQKRVDIARAIAAEPEIILMDEPTSGTTTRERTDISAAIQLVSESGVTVVLIDHDVEFVSRHCHELLVMSYGAPIGVGTPDEMLRKPEVIEAFLGITATT